MHIFRWLVRLKADKARLWSAVLKLLWVESSLSRSSLTSLLRVLYDQVFWQLAHISWRRHSCMSCIWVRELLVGSPAVNCYVEAIVYYIDWRNGLWVTRNLVQVYLLGLADSALGSRLVNSGFLSVLVCYTRRNFIWTLGCGAKVVWCLKMEMPFWRRWLLYVCLRDISERVVLFALK